MGGMAGIEGCGFGGAPGAGGGYGGSMGSFRPTAISATAPGCLDPCTPQTCIAVGGSSAGAAATGGGIFDVDFGSGIAGQDADDGPSEVDGH